MKAFSDEKIVDTWFSNAQAWIEAIHKGQIQSRIDLTNQVIIDTLTELAPDSVLDIGCGEGWLVRALCKRGIDTLGIDVVPEFIQYANNTKLGRYQILSYEQLAQGELRQTFDLVVCNFSLIGKDSVDQLFQTVPSLLKPGAFFVIQTLHPIHACGDKKYEDGWRKGSWAGFSPQFQDPAPWYFRTLETWQNLFLHNGFEIIQIREPINPKTDQAASVIIIGQLADNSTI